MSQETVSSAMTQCSFGLAPSTLMVVPLNRTFVGGMPAATVMDNKPMMNIMPFGMCQSPANPMVAAATAAAMGVLTPMPCIPFTVAPWAPGSPTVKIGGMSALNNSSKCSCNWGGLISITLPGQFTTNVP